jgi:hypothetical protein
VLREAAGELVDLVLHLLDGLFVVVEHLPVGSVGELDAAARSPGSILSGDALAAKPGGLGVTLIPVIEARVAVKVSAPMLRP